jgi:hypothetical protein
MNKINELIENNDRWVSLRYADEQLSKRHSANCLHHVLHNANQNLEPIGGDFQFRYFVPEKCVLLKTVHSYWLCQLSLETSIRPQEAKKKKIVTEKP